jgi:hypothetical protein
MDDDNRQIIAVWADDDDHLGASIFTPDGYAEWVETNHLTGTYAYPAAFYRVTPDGTLRALCHGCVFGPYGPDDYAYTSHTWTDPGIDGTNPTVYATATARRDGRA